MMKNVLTVMEVVESGNTENKIPSNVKKTLHGNIILEVEDIKY